MKKLVLSARGGKKLILSFLLIVILAWGVFAVIQSSLAIDASGLNPLGITRGITGSNAQNDIAKIIGGVIRAVLGVVGAVAFVMIVMGGIFLLTAAGDSGKVTKGKTIITWAIIGVAVVLASNMMVSYIITGITAGVGSSGTATPTTPPPSSPPAPAPINTVSGAACLQKDGTCLETCSSPAEIPSTDPALNTGCNTDTTTTPQKKCCLPQSVANGGTPTAYDCLILANRTGACSEKNTCNTAKPILVTPPEAAANKGCAIDFSNSPFCCIPGTPPTLSTACTTATPTPGTCEANCTGKAAFPTGDPECAPTSKVCCKPATPPPPPPPAPDNAALAKDCVDNGGTCLVACQNPYQFPNSSYDSVCKAAYPTSGKNVCCNGICPNGDVDSGEECDDGGIINNLLQTIYGKDGCSNQCKFNISCSEVCTAYATSTGKTVDKFECKDTTPVACVGGLQMGITKAQFTDCRDPNYCCCWTK